MFLILLRHNDNNNNKCQLILQYYSSSIGSVNISTLLKAVNWRFINRFRQASYGNYITYQVSRYIDNFSH